MKSISAITRTVTFHSRSADVDQLADRLLQAAALASEAPGCELWLVERDLGERPTLRVSEMWASRAQCDAALDLPGVAENAAAIMELLDGPPEIVEGQPLGGARMIRGLKGATAFPILEAPDLSEDAGLLGRYGLSGVAEARYVRDQLGAVQTGLTHYRLGPNRRQGWAHRHGVAEEIYVALSGSGHIHVDGAQFELRTLVAVRVAPGSARELEAGEEGLEVLAFGMHSPGDGKLVEE
jgi:quinol monooxygenase YgiN/mannose-6-phosphate isomerase-like protein (cupin superfamily)